MAIGMPQ